MHAKPQRTVIINAEVRDESTTADFLLGALTGFTIGLIFTMLFTHIYRTYLSQ